MKRPDRSLPTPVKRWSFAGLILTYWCNARCASCHLCCGPERQEEMSVTQALAYWRSLIGAGAGGCRVHLSGGEPFGNWEGLVELCQLAKAQGLGPLEKVETNAFWAMNADLVRQRLAALDQAGMGKLVISTDPYHQEFVPIERARLAAKVARESLGEHRVQVRWRDWLKEGFDTDGLSPLQRADLFARYAASGRDRLNGRAARELAPQLQARPVEELAGDSCAERLLRSRHVHVDPGGRVMPGTCAGIVLGLMDRKSIGEIWQRLTEDWASRPVVGTLASRGPAELVEWAKAAGFVPQAGYADKCHLCWDIRRHLAGIAELSAELGPSWLYQDHDHCPAGENRLGQAGV
jgi:MoaA/NifB/PqqE/SkfB family radical SAM enzyme